MKNLKSLTQSQWVVVSTFAALSFVVLWLLVAIIVQSVRYSSQIDAIEPRLERLTGLMASEEQLQQAHRSAIAGLNDLVYVDNQDVNALGTSMQQRVRNLLAQAGLRVTGSQVGNANELEGFTEISVTVSTEGTLEALVDALTDIAGVRPLVFIERIDIKPERRRNNAKTQSVEVRMQLVSMRLDR